MSSISRCEQPTRCDIPASPTWVSSRKSHRSSERLERCAIPASVSTALILQEGQCSITLIQRRLRLGYARAARIVDVMERQGIVGPADGSKPREVLVGPDILDSL